MPGAVSLGLNAAGAFRGGWRWSLGGGAFVLVVTGCAGTNSETRKSPERSDQVLVSQRLTVASKAGATGRSARPLDSIPAAQVRAWVNRQAPQGVSPGFIRGYGDRTTDLPLRLVGTFKDHRAVQLILDRAELMAREGFDSDVTQLETVRRIRATLAGARERLAVAAPSEKAQRRGDVAAQAAELELHTWRLAHQVGALLGGSVWPSVAKGYEALIMSDPEAALAAVEPDDPAYHSLVAGLQQYRRLSQGDLADFELGKIRSTIRWLRLKGGKRDPRVGRLRQRLAAEGLETSPKPGAENHFDADLVRALARFQTLNGLPDTGRMSALTFKALRVSVATRTEQIQQALDTLRTSKARKAPYRLVVNIPAFRLRLLDGGKQVVAHRVVVGNNKKVYDTNTGRTRFGNRTPVLTSKVRELVLNPAWRVPRRIKENELDRRAEYRPEVYDDYRFYYDSSGVEWAVQLPGPGNALGRVKFVFSGGNGVYLHDTPKKRDFAKDYRALSHGCVRVQDALGLAKTLLERDNNRIRWRVARSILSSRRETPVRLNRPVSIHLEYRLVGASKDGQLRFYPDIYRRFSKRDKKAGRRR